ncbi:hypothetical protein Q6247_25810, partial [Klebsiella pneumoniae]
IYMQIHACSESYARPETICAGTLKLEYLQAELTPTSIKVTGVTGLVPTSTDGSMLAGDLSDR